MTRYANHVNTRETAQNVQARPDQIQNNAGGYVFAVDKWKRLDRFLILGAEGGTFYVSEQKLTRDNAKALSECLAEDGLRTVARIVEISDAGRAPKNDPAIFALAMAAGYNGGGGFSRPEDDAATRKAALAALPKVCRIGTHLFHFANDVKNFRGWGPSLQKAIAAWYTAREADKVAFDLVKYQSRDGWGHRDLIKLSHPKAPTAAHKAAFAWSARGEHMDAPTKKKGGGERGTVAALEALPAVIGAFIEMHSGVDPKRACELILKHRLPHECVPNELKGRPEIWEALAEHMGPTALMRNLNKMTAVGLFKPMSGATTLACAKLTEPTSLFKARVHPMAVLIALKAYSQGRGDKGSLVWSPVREIVDALDTAFYTAFEAIEPTGKRMLLALDISGSMNAVIDRTNISAREGSAAMAMVTARTEKLWHAVGFTSNGYHYGRGVSMHSGYPAGLTELKISPRQRLDDICKETARLPMGGTDCALPMLYAIEKKIEVDCFSIFTDNETWHGAIHPFQALRQYRERMGIDAKLVVVGMTSTGFTIADPTDAGCLDVVGFDAAAPAVIADFAANREVQH